MHLALALVRRQRPAREPPLLRSATARLQQALLAGLPFAPTPDQSRALAEVQGDLAAPLAGVRLLQGDVGSGKTLVAFMAMLTAVEAGRQAVLMAPTELLARQHHRTLGAWAAPLGLEVGLVVGGDARPRAELLTALAEGRLLMAVGTPRAAAARHRSRRSGPRDRRRAAPLRRGAAPGPGEEIVGCLAPPHERHADPAQPGSNTDPAKTGKTPSQK